MKLKFVILKRTRYNELLDRESELKNPNFGNLTYEQLIDLDKILVNKLNDIRNRIAMVQKLHKNITNKNGKSVKEYGKKYRSKSNN